jgi:SAM-dependent methyltransferase
VKHGKILSTNGSWDDQVAKFVTYENTDTWRTYCDRLTTQLLTRFGPATIGKRAMKTDLFDEAAGGGVAAALNTVASQVFGTDLSATITETAHRKDRSLRVLQSDVRALPLASDSFDFVLSNSTLDHFENRDDVDRSVDELHRILVPGGELLITLDNPLNPVVALRSGLPLRLLRRSGAVPYDVGATLSMKRLVRLLESTGFRVEGTGTLMHVPRFFALHLAHWKDVRRQGGPDERAVARMLRWEWLGRLPTRQFTAHFIVVRAVKL